MYNIDVACQGIYFRKYEELYLDRNAGATSTVKLWRQGKQELSSQDMTFQEWKIKHPEAYSELKKKADEPMYYKCFPDEHVRVPVNGCTVEFRGTIRSLDGAPLGAC